MRKTSHSCRAASVTESGNLLLGSDENQLWNLNKSFLPKTQFFHL